MPNKQLVEKYIGVIRRACDLLAAQLDEDVSQTFDELARDVPKQAQISVVQSPDASELQDGPTEEEKQHKIARNHHVAALLGIDCWPNSVPSHQVGVTPTESDQINRANAILDSTLETSVEGKHFLDYGCGDGYIASEASLRGATVTGYDIVSDEFWYKLGNEKVNYTTDVNSLKPKGYDVIFLNDVLDHSSDPVGVMSHIKYLAKPKAIIHARCHPWTSRHASHLPKCDLNYAYIHLFLTYEELVERGYTPIFTRIEKNPMEAYKWWMRDFRVLKETPTYDGVNGFFFVPAFKELLASEQQLSPEEVDPFLERMTIQFVSFVLEA